MVDLPGVPSLSPETGEARVSVEVTGLANGTNLTFRVQPYYDATGGRKVG